MTASLLAPKVGAFIYIPPHSSDSSGYDYLGGRATVVSVTKGISAGDEVPFVQVHGLPGMKHNWVILRKKQEELRARYGDKPFTRC
jgi:hypothetical protein